VITTNKVEPLSNDLTKITTEIKTYQSIGGRSIFEIGRRLKWVKDHNLAHGEFDSWLADLRIDRSLATRAMKISSQLTPNYATSHNLGTEALYLIATMPLEERDKPQQLNSGETKKPDEMTVRELREVKKKLKQREQELADRDETIANQQAELEDNRKVQLELNKRNSELSKRQPEQKVITKTVTKEVPVKPDDYDEIKAKIAELKEQSAKDKENIEYYKRELKAAERINKNANSYDKLQEQELKRKKRQAEINGYSASLKINDWIPELQKLSQEDIDEMGEQAQKNLQKRLELLQHSIDRLSSMLGGRRVIEGDYQ
jgi:DNA repair exonuclease SbcCD ATPase subunit